MGKKIVALNGSPRAKGNTSSLIEAFTRGAAEKGHSVTTFFLDGMNIGGCKSCYGGGKNPESPCVQKDDMDKIYPVYRKADVVVLASPLYFWTISGQLKSTFDRLFAIAEGNPGYQNPVKDCILLMAAEGDEYEETLAYYNGLLNHLGWNNVGQILARGVAAPGDIAGKPELEEARILGASL